MGKALLSDCDSFQNREAVGNIYFVTLTKSESERVPQEVDYIIF